MSEPAGGVPGPAATGPTADTREPVEDWLAQWIADAVPGEQPEALLRVLRTFGRWDRGDELTELGRNPVDLGGRWPQADCVTLTTRRAADRPRTVPDTAPTRTSPG